MKKSKKEGIKNFIKGLGLAAYVFLVWQISQYAIGYLTIFILGRANYNKPFWFTIVGILTYLLAIFLIIFIPKHISKKLKATREEIGLSGLPTFTDIGVSILGYISTILIAGTVILILEKLHLVDAAAQQDIGFNNISNGTGRALAYILIAVIAPLAEEIIFRGYLYGTLRKNLSIIPSIIIVSVLFGALHSPLNVSIDIAILSTILCLEREITGTIHAGIITHILQNSIAFIILVIRGII